MAVYTFSLVQTLEELNSLKSQWDSLLESAVFDSFFCCHDWITCCWQSFSNKKDAMAVVVACKNDTPVAIAPLMIRPLKRYGFSLNVLMFIGVPYADRCDILIAKGEEGVIPGLADFLLKIPGWDQVHLNELPEKSLFANWLMENRTMVFVEPGSRCPYVPLENWDTWEDYYASLSKSTRKLVNRKGNQLSKQFDITYTHYSDFQRDEHAFKQAGKLEQESDKASWVNQLVLGDEYRYVFHKKLASVQTNSQVLLVGLEIPGTLLSYFFGFIYKNKFHFYNTAYSTKYKKFSPGLLVFREAIKFCKEHNIKEFDCLRGETKVKRHWARDRIRQQINIYWLKKRPSNWLYKVIVFGVRPFLKTKIIPLLQTLKNK